MEYVTREEANAILKALETSTQAQQSLLKVVNQHQEYLIVLNNRIRELERQCKITYRNDGD